MEQEVKDKDAERIKIAISEQKALSLYFTIIEAMAEKILDDPSIELDNGVSEFENAIWLIRKGYGI